MQAEVGTPALAGWLGGEEEGRGRRRREGRDPIAYFVRNAPSQGNPSSATCSGRSCWLFRTAGTGGWIRWWTHWLSWQLLSRIPVSTGVGTWPLCSFSFAILRPSRRETNAFARPFARHAEQGWATIPLAYIKELDLIEQRRSNLRKPRAPRKNLALPRQHTTTRNFQQQKRSRRERGTRHHLCHAFCVLLHSLGFMNAHTFFRQLFRTHPLQPSTLDALPPPSHCRSFVCCRQWLSGAPVAVIGVAVPLTPEQFRRSATLWRLP